MAKVKMMCPFSKKLCQECPQYRGRHYYLCFYSRYGGCLGNSEEKSEKKMWSRGTSRDFEMPSSLPSSPKWLVLKEFAERKDK